MGNFLTKSSKNQDIILAEASIVTTPIATKKVINQHDLDPRSPTAEIIRTPIQTLNNFYQHKFDDKSISFKEISNEYSSDISTEMPEPTSNVRNKNLDDMRIQLLKFTPLKNAAKLADSTQNTPNNPATDDNRKSIVGLLETNIDYIETDLDAVVKTNTLTKPLTQNVTPKKHQKFNGKSQMSDMIQPKELLRAKFLGMTETEDLRTPEKFDSRVLDPRSPSDEVTRTPVQIVKTLDVDPRSPVTEFVRTPIQIVKVIDKTDVSEDLKEIVLDKINLLEEIDVQEETSEKEEIKENEKDLKKDENFEILKTSNDKDNSSKKHPVLSDQMLIYEDNFNINYETVAKKITESNRTPLKDRNTNGNSVRSKSANGKVKQHTEFNKSEYTVSKIPIFKEKKSAKNKLSYKKHTENIPPTDKDDYVKKAQWDNADSTMII